MTDAQVRSRAATTYGLTAPETCGLACYDEVARSVAGRGRSCRSDQEPSLTIAREKADDRGIEVEFAAADAFQLERLGRRFETVLDCGLFHTFDGDERPGYVASLASVTEHDGTLYVLCFSDDGPDTGPHPISQEELRAAFNPSNGWKVAAIESDRVQTRYHDDGAPAWFATIKRI